MIVRVKLYCIILGLVPALLLSGCASVLDMDEALAIVPYRIENSGRIIVQVRVEGRGPYNFALDSASTISAVFEELSDELELEPIPGHTVIVHGAVASGQFSLVNVGRIELESETWVNPRIVSLPGSTAASAAIDGLLGVDFLRHYAVGFSATERVLRLYPPKLVAERYYRGWASVPLRTESVGTSGASVYLIDIDIAGLKFPAVFDLGAGLNLINWAGARRLGIDSSKLKDEQIIGPLGSSPVNARLETEEITTASVIWRDEHFLIADLKIFETLSPRGGPAIILGAGLFTQRDFVIDFVRNRLLVRTAMKEKHHLGKAKTRPRTLEQFQSAGKSIR